MWRCKSCAVIFYRRLATENAMRFWEAAKWGYLRQSSQIFSLCATTSEYSTGRPRANTPSMLVLTWSTAQLGGMGCCYWTWPSHRARRLDCLLPEGSFRLIQSYLLESLLWSYSCLCVPFIPIIFQAWFCYKNFTGFYISFTWDPYFTWPRISQPIFAQSEWYFTGT